jgi:drug/metabolite transporter (DMT)-like permease
VTPAPVRSAVAGVYGSAYVLLPAAALSWAGNSVVGRTVHGRVPPIGLSFWRWLLALAIIAPIGWPRVRADAAELRRGWRIVLVLALSGVAAFGTFLYLGLRTTTAINSAILQSIIPLLILVFAFVCFRERPTARGVAGLALSLVGVLVVVTRGHPFDLLDTRLVTGDLWVLLGVVGYAGYSAALRVRPAVHPLSLLTVTFAIATAVLAPAYLVETLTGPHMPLTATAFWAVAYTAVFPSLVAYFCFNRGVELVGPARAGQFIHLVPVFAVLLAVLFLDERLAAFQAAGGALVAAGIVVSSPRGRR